MITAFGTTANGGFDINSISSFLDDDGSSTKLDLPLTLPSGKGSFSYGSYPASGPSIYGYKGPPSYNSPALPTASPPIYSLKPAASPNQAPTPSPYSPQQTQTKGYVLGDQALKAATAYGQDQYAGAATPINHGTYRPPNKNYVLGDPSLKNSNAPTQYASSASNPLFPSSHGSYRPPNKNYVLGDPSLNKGSSISPSFFPQQTSFNSHQVSNFGANSPYNPPSGLGSHSTLGIGSSTPSYDNSKSVYNQNSANYAHLKELYNSQNQLSYDSNKLSNGGQTVLNHDNNKVIFGGQNSGISAYGVQQGTFGTSSVGFPGNSFPSTGQNKPVNYPTGHTNVPTNNYKLPTYGPTGVSSPGVHSHLSNPGQVNFGSTQLKYGPQNNPGLPLSNQQYNFVANSNKYNHPGIGGFATNYLIPSGNYVNQPGNYISQPSKYVNSPSRRPGSQLNYVHQGPAYNPSANINLPSGASSIYGHYSGSFKAGSPYKGEGSYVKGAYNPGRYRRVPGQYSSTGQYSSPYRGALAQPSQKRPSYLSPSPFSVFEDLVLL